MQEASIWGYILASNFNYSEFNLYKAERRMVLKI